MNKDEKYMTRAICLARIAAEKGDVPVGAVIVKDDTIISEAYNLRVNGGGTTAHAELLAIEEASRKLKSWRLSGCDLYVTLEPCPMCAGAIINGRIDRVVFGARDPRMGALGSVIDLNSYPLGHKPQIIPAVLEKECAELLTDFFSKKRAEEKDV